MTDHRTDPAPADPEKEQEPVIAFLADPRTHGGAPVERVDTHISHLFIAGGRAYKLKRAIRRNFLDYSTAERRRDACRHEVEINRRTAPSLYLGHRAVTRGPRGLALDGDGPAIDWVVEMVRFDRRQEFDRLADRGLLTADHLSDLADVIAAFHMAAPRRTDFGGASAVRATIGQVAEAVTNATGDAAVRRRAGRWRRAAEERLARHAAQLDARRRHGFVRRCHGDLHLGNICLFEGRPTPFDAIEFSEEIGTTDVLYDLAFAVMDLLNRGGRGLANVLVNRYLAHTRDYGGLSLMPLFVSMRAAVRAIAAASRGTPDGTDEAEALLRFAGVALEAAPRPLLAAIGGRSGTGKSSVARALAPSLGPGFGAVVLRSDVARKLLAGVAPEERLPGSAYSPQAARQVHARLRRDAARALHRGIPVILDATFLGAGEREAARRLAGRAGVSFAPVWLHASGARLAERLRQRGRDASDATPSLLQRQESAGSPANWPRVAADAPLAEVTASAERAIAAASAGPAS